MFWFGIQRAVLQRQVSSGKGKTYLYHLNIEPSADNPDFYKTIRKLFGIPHMNGTCHAEDLPLVFKTQISRRFKKGDDNYEAQQVFLNSFIQFFKCDNPHCQTLNGKITWVPVPNERSDNVPCMEICRDNFVVQQLSKYDKIKIWNDLYDDNQSLI